jgi:alginate O-acetyltransferase complex protein AlgI
VFSTPFFDFSVFKSGALSASILVFIFSFIIIEWIGREQQYAIAKMFSGKPKIYRWAFYYLIVIIIFIFAGSNQQFIYFQF